MRKTYHYQDAKIATAKGLINVHFLSVGVHPTLLVEEENPEKRAVDHDLESALNPFGDR